MRILPTFLLILLFSINSYAFQCPTVELVGSFKTVEVQGCEGYEDWMHVSAVENEIQGSTLITGFVFNNSDEPSQKHWIKETMDNSQLRCVNTKTTKLWRWFPSSPRSNFYWGFAYRAGTYYAERGHNCRYKLQKL